MQAVFKAVVEGDVPGVVSRLERKPGLLRAVAMPPPLKFAGCTPLQVAIRSGNSSLAAMLIEMGANVDVVPLLPDGTAGRPLVHDAIVAAVMSSQWVRPSSFAEDNTEWIVVGSEGSADDAFNVLEEVLKRGANLGSLDQWGNTALERAILTAKEILPGHSYSDPTWVDPRPLNPELVEDLHRIFSSLYFFGADPDIVAPNLAHQPSAYYRNEPVGLFLTKSGRRS